MMTSRSKERDYYARVAELGCFICGQPAEVHHKTGAGMGKKAHYSETMSLCPNHHRLGSFGQCVHNGAKTFEANYYTQDYMIEQTRERLGYEDTIRSR